jgi:hypothetical protein
MALERQQFMPAYTVLRLDQQKLGRARSKPMPVRLWVPHLTAALSPTGQIKDLPLPCPHGQVPSALLGDPAAGLPPSRSAVAFGLQIWAEPATNII